MSNYADQLVRASFLLLRRKRGQRGKLPSALIRRSISTSYYALFHFILDEIGRKAIGVKHTLRIRRHILIRTITHQTLLHSFQKSSGVVVEKRFTDFFKFDMGAEAVNPPAFFRSFAYSFIDAQAKRHEADYNLNSKLSETDARLLAIRTRRVIKSWRRPKDKEERDFIRAFCLFVLLGGNLRN